MVLERPEIPLHTNASENDLRACVTKRRISGGTMSADGRQARDVMLGLNAPPERVSILPELAAGQPVRALWFRRSVQPRVLEGMGRTHLFG